MAVQRYVVPRLACKRKTFVRDINITATALYGVFTFKLSDLPSGSEFTNLFQAYKINGVRLDFVPTANSADVGSATMHLPIMHYVYDFDDTAPPTSYTEVFQYDTVKSRRCDKPWSLFIKPKVLTEAFQQGVTQAYGYSRNMWLSTAYPSVEHYGVKYYLESPVIQSNTLIKVYATYYLSMKSVK